ncbi:MAG: hypothetical protein WAP35_08845 [Solirubrobacterales bacterium]
MKAVELIWHITPFRSDKFIETWQPYAELAINYGAKGYMLVRQADDELIVKQYAFFESKADWERYWNSDALIRGRAEISGYFTVPQLYTWQEVHSLGFVEEPADAPAAATASTV